MTRWTGVVAALTAVVGFLLGLVAGTTRSGSSAPPAALRSAAGAPPLVVATVPATPSGERPGAAVDFAEVASRVNAAVVNVDAASRGDDRLRSTPRWRRDIGDDPGAPREGSGSGFIIDPSGYLLTNFHVIEGADRVTVTLGDGRSFRAEVVGTDPAIDVALLRIPGTQPLPVAVLGDSETLRVGEWVCAIGNPLGYVHSVTVGVVSFLGRKLFDQSLDAFIQTDAAISFGNSGGPLIDAEGRVVGITTAVSAQASNIGFAIPIGQVVAVLPQLRQSGRVARGYIGVGLAQVTPALGVALGLGVNHGALVQDVTPGTPGERAGLRTYDAITGVDGVAIQSDEELIRYVSGRAPGSLSQLEVWRDGALRRLTVKLTDRPLPPSTQTRSQRTLDPRPAAGQDRGPLGLTVRDLDRATAMRQRLPDGMEGAIVVDVDPAGPARLARIRTGHVVLEINRQRVASAADFERIVAGLSPGVAAAVLLYDQLADTRVIAAIVPDPRS